MSHNSKGTTVSELYLVLTPVEYYYRRIQHGRTGGVCLLLYYNKILTYIVLDVQYYRLSERCCAHRGCYPRNPISTISRYICACFT